MFFAEIQATAETFDKKPHIRRPFAAVTSIMENLRGGVIEDLKTGFYSPFAKIQVVIIEEQVLIKEPDLAYRAHSYEHACSKDKTDLDG